MLREVIVVSHKYPPYSQGGLAPYVERSLRALSKARPQVSLRLYTMAHPPGLPREDVDAAGLALRRIALPGLLARNFLRHSMNLQGRAWFAAGIAWFNLATAGSLMRLGRRHGAILAVHDWQSTPTGILMALLRGVPTVYHVHNTELSMTQSAQQHDPLGLISLCERLMVRCAAAVVVPTPELKALVVRNGWPEARVHVIPHGYESVRTLEHSDADADSRCGDSPVRERLGIPPGRPLIVYAGRLSRTKGVPTLVHALALLVDRGHDVHLAVLGGPFPGSSELEDVRGVIRDHRLEARVHVYGEDVAEREVEAHFDAADVCAFPSTYEPFGFVAVEAMALGRPVVVGPGFSEVIAPSTGETTAARALHDDPATLADVLDHLLRHPGDAEALGQRGQRHVRAHLSWQASTRVLLQCYENALHNTEGRN